MDNGAQVIVSLIKGATPVPEDMWYKQCLSNISDRLVLNICRLIASLS
jgi:hypothetical protein